MTLNNNFFKSPHLVPQFMGSSSHAPKVTGSIPCQDTYLEARMTPNPKYVPRTVLTDVNAFSLLALTLVNNYSHFYS